MWVLLQPSTRNRLTCNKQRYNEWQCNALQYTAPQHLVQQITTLHHTAAHILNPATHTAVTRIQPSAQLHKIHLAVWHHTARWIFLPGFFISKIEVSDTPNLEPVRTKTQKTLKHRVAHCSTLQHILVVTYHICCSTLQHILVVTYHKTLQHTTVHCNTLQYTRAQCNSLLQHTAAHCNICCSWQTYPWQTYPWQTYP